MRRNITQQSPWWTISLFAVLLGGVLYRTVTGSAAPADVMGRSPIGELTAMTGMSETLRLTIAGTLITLNALWLLQLTPKHGLALIYAPLPATTFLMVGFLISPQADPLHSALLSLLVTGAIDACIPVFQNGVRMHNVFVSNALIGVATLLYPPILPFAAVFCIMASRFHASGSVTVVSVAGLLTPLLLASWGWWVAGAPFGHVAERVWSLLTERGNYSLLAVFEEGLFLNGALALCMVVCMVMFVVRKRSIEFTLLITAKYGQDCLVALFAVALLETVTGIADGAMFPAMGVITAPLIYQLYSKMEGKFARISHWVAIVLAVSYCMI